MKELGNRIGNRGVVYLGVTSIMLGILFNKWLIETTFASDNGIETPGFIAIIFMFQAVAIGLGAYLLVKRSAISIKRPSRAEFILLIAGMAVALVMAEFLSRLVLTPPPTFDEVIKASLYAPERLFRPNLKLKAVLRTSENRLIEPEPEPELPARHRVLFLGGITTEALYVPENQRWVALLNEPGELAAYNGGQGAANILDKYFTFEYLTGEKEYQFDLVVLMTAMNDFSWMRKLERTGGSLRMPNYRDDLLVFYVKGDPQSFWERVKLRVSLIYWTDRVVSQMHRQVLSPSSVNASGFLPVESEVVVELREKRDWTLRQYDGRHIPLDECQSYADEMRLYLEIESDNIGLLARTAAAKGTKLLVLSEPMSYGAPADSFQEDFRLRFFCENGLLADSDSYAMWKEINQQYLRAAREAGALTFDLASAVDPLFNGPQGGKYVYDAMHFTDEGSREVARALRPVLSEILVQIELSP